MKQKRFVLLSALTSALLTFSALPDVYADAEIEYAPEAYIKVRDDTDEEDVPASGTCGESLTWQYSPQTHALTIEGSGEMVYDTVPWYTLTDRIETVILPQGLTNIAAGAFRYCFNLKSITIPESVTSIGTYAFYYCYNLAEITLPEGVSRIEKGAFMSCSHLQTVSLPASVTELDLTAFRSCTVLTDIQIAADNPNYRSADGILYDAGMTTVLFCSMGKTGDAVLPDTVTAIQESAFYSCQKLEHVLLPAGLTVIGNNAFQDCKYLLSLNIPAAVTTIGTNAFLGCAGLTALTVDAANPNFRSIDSVLYDGTCTTALFCCTSKTDALVLPDTVTSIAANAFRECRAISAITLPDTLTEIGENAFAYCSALNTVTLPDGITAIPAAAFYSSGITEITLPQSVRTVAKNAFYGCERLETITVMNPYCTFSDSEYTVAANAAISGYPDSFVQKYADKYSRTFIPLDGTAPMQYTYEITPLLAPFNEFFFVKTDDPDPYSFRFADYDSAYGDNASVTFCDTFYEDINYENKETKRVAGGYLFKGTYTDGGTLTLQYDVQTEPPREIDVLDIGTGTSHKEIYRNPIWEDTAVKVEIDPVYDDVDYLIRTYADKDDFFANMDAVQTGFSSICLYSGSYIRGTVYRANPYWSLSNSPHVDQSLYIQSPYRRQDNKSLFASALYPYRYDSLGFPSVMGSVAKRLDSNAVTKRNSNSHYLIDVTCSGETKSYGGQGNGEGQGISKDDIIRTFTFGADDKAFTLTDIRTLLNNYAALEIPDDVPQEDNLTWTSVCDTVGSGAWVRLLGIGSVFGGQYGTYAYLWKSNDKNDFYTSDSGVGGSLYWSGSLGYGSDIWIDGRYLDQYERYVPGAVFADHPQSAIMLPDITVPQITYKRTYNRETGQYEYQDVEVTEQKQSVRFRYNTEKALWTADISSYALIETLTAQLQLDPKYLDALQLTQKEADALAVDRNTNAEPTHFFIYDGSAAAGTEVYLGDANGDGKTNLTDLVLLQRWLLSDPKAVIRDVSTCDLNRDGKLNAVDFTLLKRKLLT